MYACPHCDSTKMFMAYKDGHLLRVLEDHEDVDGLSEVSELLCVDCNEWFQNPYQDSHGRTLTGELVTITGLKSKGTIKVVASGLQFPFHYDTYESEAAEALRGQPAEFISDLREFSEHRDHTLGLRVKEVGNPNTWVYRLDRRRLWKALRT